MQICKIGVGVNYFFKKKGRGGLEIATRVRDAAQPGSFLLAALGACCSRLDLLEERLLLPVDSVQGHHVCWVQGTGFAKC